MTPLTKTEARIEKIKKEQLLPALEKYPAIAIVGRVENWLKSPESRYPQSCTVLAVEDSMEGFKGIEYSWLYVSKALRTGAGVALDLSKLRPAGTDNGKGLVSSGVCSFMEIYSKFNEIIRRGGIKFKKGAVVVFLDAYHPDTYIEPTVENKYKHGFINYPQQSIPWIKRALYVDDNPDSSEYILNHPHLDKILDAVRNGQLWLAKKRWYNKETNKLVDYPVNPLNISENRLLSQVCLEILLPSNGTCLLGHVNLGKVTLSNMVVQFRAAMRFLCRLHSITGAGKDNYYLPPNQDRQVGLGVIGLANLLARYKITYARFTDCLYDWLTDNWLKDNYYEDIDKQVIWAYENKKNYSRKELRLVSELYKSFHGAADVARTHKMKRVFTVAPTVSSSFRHKDKDGFTTTPEISPPICHPITKKVVRDSATAGAVNESDVEQVEYQYPPNIETAEQVGWDVYYKLAKAWQLLMESTGLAHSISFNIWNQCDVSLKWFEDWLESPLVTTYYRMLVDQQFADKSSIDAGLNETLSDETDDFFCPDSDIEEVNAEFAAKVCNINFGLNDAFCAACAE